MARNLVSEDAQGRKLERTLEVARGACGAVAYYSRDGRKGVPRNETELDTQMISDGLPDFEGSATR